MKKFINDLKKYESKKSVLFIYFTIRILTLAAVIISGIRGNWSDCLSCVLALFLLLLPSVLERGLKVELPSALETVIILMVYAAWVLGESESFYIRFPWWDTMLHTMNGFLCAAIGYVLFDLLNKHPASTFNLRPSYMALMSFCFSMTIGVLWEFFEFGADYFFHLDMQKDTVITQISSVMLDLSGGNKIVTISDISDVSVNGRSLGMGGYIDIGLYDTMGDLFVNFIGAAVCNLIGFFYASKKKFYKFAQSFIPKVFVKDSNGK